MRSLIISILLLLFLMACQNNQSKLEDLEEISFHCGDDAELFFKNLRQIYYDFEEQENTKLRLYRFKNRHTKQDYPIINLVIVHNWRYDEAYLLLEPNSFFTNPQNIHLKWENTGQDTEGELFFKGGNKLNHFKFARDIYLKIKDKSILKVVQEGKESLLMDDNRERETFRKTFLDYLKLLGLGA